MSYLASLIEKGNEISAQADEQQSDLPALRFFNMKIDDHKIGDNIFQFYIMPYVQEETGNEEIFQMHYKHYNMPVGFEEGKQVKISRTCIEKQGGLTCPFCEVIRQELSHTQNTEKRRNLQRMETTATAYANVLPLKALGRPIQYSQDGGADGLIPYLPHMIGLKQRVHDAIIRTVVYDWQIQQNPDMDPFNPWNACAIQINVQRTGKMKQNIRYHASIIPVRGKFAQDEDALNTLYEGIYDLTKIFKMPKDEDLEAYPEEGKAVARMLEQMRGSSSGLFTSVPKVGAKAPAPAPVSAPAPAPVAPVSEAPAPNPPKAPPKRSPVPVRPGAPSSTPAPAPVNSKGEVEPF